MEIAVTVLLAAGIKAVLARSFARTFYRNAVNNGLIPVECDTASVQEGDRLSIVLQDGSVMIDDVTRGNRIEGQPLPEIMLDILSVGGLVPYLRLHHDFHA
jgi:3-isopropylmalate/(R)-2-methylmalate dehydratase small subunit